MSNSLNCPRCSTKVPAGSRFCQSCGSDVLTGKRPNSRTRSSAQWMIFVAGALVVILVSGIAIFGLRRAMTAKEHEAAQATPAATGTAVAMIDGAGPMPAWLTKADKNVIADYTWAASHHDELQYFPCFCGCYQSAGHVSNSECYYKRDKGQIVAYDQHAYG